MRISECRTTGTSDHKSYSRRMDVPGWYHAPGDPSGTARYWDGQHWQGEPTTRPGAGQIYYAAPVETQPSASHATTARPHTTQGSRRTTSPARSRRRQLKASLKFSAIVLSILKALPLAAGTWIAYTLHFQPASDNANEIRQRFDVDFGFGLKTTMLVIVLIGGGLLLIQVSGAASNSAGMLLTAAGLLTLVDIANVIFILTTGSTRVVLPLIASIWQARIALGAAAELDRSQR